MEKQNNIRYTLNIALRLLLICGAVALLLALINNFTAPVTAEKEAAEKHEKMHALFPDMTGEQEKACELAGVNAVYEIYEGDTLTGYCCNVQTQGFSDVIEMMVGFDAQTLTVTGVTIVSCTDNPGKNKISDPGFLNSFTGHANAQDVDGISGATYSSQGVRTCVDLAAKAVENVRGGDAS